MECPTCGEEVWGEKGVEGGYCSFTCAETGRIRRRAEDIGPKLVADEAARLRAAPCERCARRRPVEAHPVYTGDHRETVLSCKRCGLDEQATAIFRGWILDEGRTPHSAASAPLDLLSWFLPFSLAHLLGWAFNTALNLWAMTTRFAWGRPSSDLRRVAAERLAAAQLQTERSARLAEMVREQVESVPHNSGDPDGNPQDTERSEATWMPNADETIRKRRREDMRREQD